MQKENQAPTENHQYVGPYRLEKTLGKGQTGMNFLRLYCFVFFWFRFMAVLRPPHVSMHINLFFSCFH